jgi:F-type H+-transporting ATPase subunit 8
MCRTQSPLDDPLQHPMPQLVPFYFVNQLSFALLALALLTALLSQYVLPALLQLQVTRAYIVKV